MRFVSLVGAVLVVVAGVAAAGGRTGGPPSDAEVRRAFLRQGIRLAPAELEAIRANVELALEQARAHGIGNSKVDFAAVEIASRLGLDTVPGLEQRSQRGGRAPRAAGSRTLRHARGRPARRLDALLRPDRRTCGATARSSTSCGRRASTR